MRLSDGLRAQRAERIERLDALSKRAADEERVFDASEGAEWDVAKREIADLDKAIARQQEAEEMRREGTRFAVDERGERHLILTRDMKFSDRLPSRYGRPLNIAATLRGAITGRFDDDFDAERRAMGEIS